MQKIWKLIVGLYERFRELFWYGVFGVITTIINMVAFWLFSDALKVYYMVSNVVVIIGNYVLSTLVVFRKSWIRDNAIRLAFVQFYWKQTCNIEKIFCFAILHGHDINKCV